MKPFFSLLLLACAATLGGCGSWVGEERAYFMKREWQQATHTNWLGEADERIGISKTFGSAKRREMDNEKQICLHPNGQNRIITQDGVSDELAYRRCVLAPYPNDGGQRMGIRPDGVGSVVK